MKKIYKRKLDDQAKIFSLSCNRKDTSIFRLSTNLKQKVDKDLLQQATEKALDKYSAFKVKVKKGFFLYYLEQNDKKPIVQEKTDYNFKFIHYADNNDFLFKVSYEGKKITIDYFHILTDGNTGREFFNEIIYNYLELKHPNSIGKNTVTEETVSLKPENSYKKNYLKKIGKSYNPPQAYQVKGKELENGKVGINQFNIKLTELKKCAKEQNCSISEFLVSMIAYSLYETNYKKNKGKKPINICVPINLKKYFKSETISNFVSHMMISLKVKTSKKHSFNDILSMVKKEFSKKLNIEKISNTMTSNGKSINNFFVNILPLAIKKFFVVLGSINVKKKFTITLSNLGTTNIDEKYSKYIKKCSFVLPPDWAEKIRCGVCSYKDNLVVSFSSNIKENSFENKFKELLNEYKIKFKLEGNGIKPLTN